MTIPPQEVITRDNVPARVNAVVMFQVTDPIKAIMAVENYAVATSQIAQTTLRSLLGRADLDTLLAHREGLNDDLRSIIEKQTEPWGVEVRVVEIKDVEIPESMQRAMAREAEAERERRAKVINARGELQASDELRQAAETLSKSPASLQLRYLQTLLELGADQNSTVVFPLPVDIITPFLQGRGLRESIGEALNGETTKNRELHPDCPPFPWHPSHLSPLTSHLSPRACVSHLDTPRYRDTLRTLAERCPNSQASVLAQSSAMSAYPTQVPCPFLRWPANLTQ